MLKVFFKDIDKRSFLIWGLALLIILGVEIIATVLIPVWREYFFNGVEAKDHSVFYQGLWLFTALMGTFALTQGLKYYVGSRVAFIWRMGIIKTLQKAWFKEGKPSVKCDNPDQRIAQDSLYMTDMAMNVFIEVVISASIIIGLIAQMWGDWLLLTLALAYTAIASVIAFLFHRPLINREKDWEAAEADFRFKLGVIRHEGKIDSTRSEIKSIVKTYLDKILYMMGFTLVSKSKSYLMNFIPYIVLIPMFFAGEITFGHVMKGISQFDLLVINATILIIMYPNIIKALAAYERIVEFYKGLNE